MAHGAAKYLLLLTCPALLAQAVVREEKPVVVDGVTEVWRLVWKQPPKPACSTDDAGSFTCPCNGFAFGEAGKLDLLRIRIGREIDRLSLTPLFVEVPVNPPQALVQRWEPSGRDINTDAPALARRARLRPVVDIMDLADYDHDGKSTEFFLQTNTEPCGKRYGVVLGLSAGNQRLHAFGSVRRPRRPLVLQKSEWDAVRASAGPVRVVDWACGDHGADTETEVELQATSAGIRALRLEYGCDEHDHRGKLLSRKEF